MRFFDEIFPVFTFSFLRLQNILYFLVLFCFLSLIHLDFMILIIDLSIYFSRAVVWWIRWMKSMTSLENTGTEHVTLHAH